MIEVEIRGRLNDKQFDELTALLEKEGELVEFQDREMILLRGYPGYSEDPTARDVDVRLRNTNGSCEIMVKHKSGEHNVARKEMSLPLGCSDLESAKEAVAALGYRDGIWMHRKKKVFRYSGIEWSVVDVPEGMRYFEAEQETGDPAQAKDVELHLIEEAQKLGLSAMGPQEMRDFIYELDAKVNKEITW